MSQCDESAADATMGHTEVQTRAATAEDVPEITSLAAETPSAAHWPETSYARMLAAEAPRRIALVAESRQSSSVAGFVIARIASDDCELENIVVAPHKQRRGVATELIQALATAARNQNATRIYLEVRESNAAARALYESCGFAITGRRPAYYNNPVEDALLYALPL